MLELNVVKFVVSLFVSYNSTTTSTIQAFVAFNAYSKMFIARFNSHLFAMTLTASERLGRMAIPMALAVITSSATAIVVYMNAPR